MRWGTNKTRYMLPKWIMSNFSKRGKKRVLRNIERDPYSDWIYDPSAPGFDGGSYEEIYDNCQSCGLSRGDDGLLTYTYCFENLNVLIRASLHCQSSSINFECNKKLVDGFSNYYSQTYDCTSNHIKTQCKPCWDMYFNKIKVQHEAHERCMYQIKVTPHIPSIIKLQKLVVSYLYRPGGSFSIKANKRFALRGG